MTTPLIEARLPALDEATARLVATVEKMPDAAFSQPSRLPGWSRAHVVAHLCASATALTRLAAWATTGVESPAYESREARDAEIEELSRLSPDELRNKLVESADVFRLALTMVAGPAARRPLKSPAGTPLTALELPGMRLRELEMHHVDLDAGFEVADWSKTFAAETLDELAFKIRKNNGSPDVANLRATDTLGTWVLGPQGAELQGPVASLLAWLSGRSDGSDLHSEPEGDIPAPPPWG